MGNNTKKGLSIAAVFATILMLLSLITYFIFSNINYQADTYLDTSIDSSGEDDDGYILSPAPDWAPDNHEIGNSYYKEISSIPDAVFEKYPRGITKIFHVKPVSDSHELEVLVNITNKSDSSSNLFTHEDQVVITSEITNLTDNRINHFRTNFHIFSEDDGGQIDRLFSDFYFGSIPGRDSDVRSTTWIVPNYIIQCDLYIDLLVYYHDEPVCGPYIPEAITLSNTTPFCYNKCGDGVCQEENNRDHACAEDSSSCPEDCPVVYENYCQGQTTQDYYTKSDPISYFDTSLDPPADNTFEDYCIDDSNTLVEGICSNDELLTEEYVCPYGCSDGACIMPDPETVYASPGIFSINVYSYDQPPSDEDEEESDEGDEDEDEEIEFDPIITENPELINQDNEVSGDDVFNTPSESVSISGIQSGPGFSVTIIIVILFSSYLIYRIIKKEE